MAATDPPAPLSRPRRGRWLGGVCAGLAARWALPVAGVRAAFAIATAALGLGALAYAAFWLILPGEGEEGEASGSRGIVVLAQACGALVALATLAAAGAVATVFGFGWVVVAVGAAVLVGVLAGWPRVGPAWALLPIGALALPSVALAAGGLRIEPRTTPELVAPRTVAALPEGGFRSGLNLLQVDLRRTALPKTGTIALRIEAGVRRTLVALPHERCVHVEVRQHALPAATRIAAVALGAGLLSTPGVQLFGDFQESTALAAPEGRRRGPTLRIDFSSDGGSLVVRDYPDDVDPAVQPDWPGYPVDPEVRPDVSVYPKEDRKEVLRAWRIRRREQVRDQRAIERLMGGPCARPQRERAGGRSHRETGRRHPGDEHRERAGRARRTRERTR